MEGSPSQMSMSGVTCDLAHAAPWMPLLQGARPNLSGAVIPCASSQWRGGLFKWSQGQTAPFATTPLTLWASLRLPTVLAVCTVASATVFHLQEGSGYSQCLRWTAEPPSGWNDQDQGDGSKDWCLKTGPEEKGRVLLKMHQPPYFEFIVLFLEFNALETLGLAHA